MSNLYNFAKHELSLIGGQDDEMQQEMNRHILEIVKIFADEGHSGISAPYAVNILNKVLRFEPITPLTGADDEWNKIGDGSWQNRRCPHVFKDAENGAYDIQGRIFREPSGVCYTSRDSRVPVTFPYTPTSEYVDVPAEDPDQ